MSNSPHFKASIVIPTYNRREPVSNSVRSLCRQTCPVDDYEVIIVDDGSDDQTFQEIKSVGAGLNLKYVFQPDRGYRACRARNQGIAVAEGGICIFVDGGNLLASGFVAAHLNYHARAENAIVVGYIYGFFATVEPQRPDAVNAILDPSDVDGSIARFERDGTLCDTRETVYAALNDDLSQANTPWAYCFGGNYSAPTELVRKVGGYDEFYQSWGDDDIDIALALHQAGGRFILSREAAAIQTPHEKNVESRMASHRKNVSYLHGKYNTPETARFKEGGWRGMPIARVDRAAP